MKKIKKFFIGLLLSTAMLVSTTCQAVDTDFYTSPDSECTKVNLTNGEMETEVSLPEHPFANELNYTKVDDYISYMPTVSICATMNGTDCVPMYWSDPVYRLNSQKKTVAVLKADETHTWSSDSAIILRVTDPMGYAQKLQIAMAASEDGPKDYCIEYSMDGKKYIPLNTKGTHEAEIFEKNTVTDLFQKSLVDIKPVSSKRRCISSVRGEDSTISITIRNDVYYRISVSSDQKVSGEAGLYGSNTGEMALVAVAIRGARSVIDDPKSGTVTGQVDSPKLLSAYKVTEKSIQLHWARAKDKASNRISGYVIYLKKGDDAYKKVATVPRPDRVKYTLKGLSARGKYQLKLRAFARLGATTAYSVYTKAITVNMKKQPLPTDLKVTRKLHIKVGQERKLPVICKNGTSRRFIKQIKYVVRNKKIVAVTGGKVKAKRKGNTIIITKIVLKSGFKRCLRTRIEIRG